MSSFENTFKEESQLSEINEKNFVQYTGLMTATIRAIETKRPDRIMSDPYAEMLSGEAGQQFFATLLKLNPQNHDSWHNGLPIRTRYLDEFINASAPMPQVVVLAAGLDSRPYRLGSLNRSRVFELDVSTWFKRKVKVLGEVAKPVCESYYPIEADLSRDPWDTWLLERGLNPTLPTLWTLEGLLYYLDRQDIDLILGRMNALSCRGSRFWADVFGAAALCSQTPVFSAFRYGTDQPLEDLFLPQVKECEPVGSGRPEWKARVSADLSVPGMHFGRSWAPMVTADGRAMPWYFVEGVKE